MENERDGSNMNKLEIGMPVRTENIAFAAEEMESCGRCGKANPPNRASCLYCAAPIGLSDERKLKAKLNLRVLENWEKGANIVFVPPAKDPDIAGISSYLAIDPDILRQILAAACPIPLARIESDSEASLAVRQLENLGVNALVIGDELLRAEKLPTRLRSIEFRSETIIASAFNTGEKIGITADDLVLIVPGVLTESRREAVEKRKKKEVKVLRETETANDEKLIDIYIADERFGFRIPSNGFDFSCLGAQKGLLAGANMDVLEERLAGFASNAKVIDEYRAAISVLGSVWELDREKDFQGLTKTGIGRSGFANVARTSNLTQFTKYSRLQRELL